MALTIQQIQDNITAKNDQREIINQIADYLQASGSGGLPYKVYTGFVTHSATDAPIVTFLQNTIGNIVWSRNGVGAYDGTSSGAFTTGKTIVVPFGGNGLAFPNGNYLPIFSGVYEINVSLDPNVIQLFSYDDATNLNPKELSSCLNGAGIFIEIRVYP